MVFFSSRWRKGAEGMKHEDRQINVLINFRAADNLSAKGGRRTVEVCGGVAVMVALLIILGLVSSDLRVEVFQPQLPATVRLIGKAVHIQAERDEETDGLIHQTRKSRHTFIEDAVVLPEEILLLVRSSSNFRLSKEQMQCVFSNQTLAKVLGVDSLAKRIAVRCEIPHHHHHPHPAADHLLLHQGVSLLLSQPPSAAIAIEAKHSFSLMHWDRQLVYEATVMASEVILFVKGFGAKQAEEMDVDDWWCCFGHGEVETRVTMAAQEVFRCQNPPSSLRATIQGEKITLRRSNGPLIPSIAYYDPDKNLDVNDDDDNDDREDLSSNLSSYGVTPAIANSTVLPPRKYFLCACTMIFNSAKFLREWISYHSFLGVERFFLYDNNSEDDIHEEVRTLTAAAFNVSRHPWPWIKSQEAGFSHCSLRARTLCTWIMYTDVDEFVFPTAWLHHHHHHHHPPPPPHSPIHSLHQIPILKALILKTASQRSESPDNSSDPPDQSNRIGQISLRCRDFGPSGLLNHPPQGLMQGYTCRLRNEQRHKSIVRPAAIATSLINVVHHFKLQPQFQTIQVSTNEAVINHYKYQAWEEFKTKFRRRVSAYVTDWRVKRNIHSKDRTPGLGSKAIKPLGWEHQFCEVHDTLLQEYARHLANSSLLLLYTSNLSSPT